MKILFFFLGCSPKKSGTEPPPTTVESTSKAERQGREKSPPPFPIQNNTERLVKEGILDPVPNSVKVGDTITIQFRTLYPNGCWQQSEAKTSIDEQKISHSYTTTYEGEGRMCTMAFVPGGFTTEISPKKLGTWEGAIWVNDEERARYSFTVVEP